MNTSEKRVFLYIILFFVAVMIVSPYLGIQKISPWDVTGGGEDDIKSEIFWRLRVPRVLAAFAAGAALALSGMVFQAMFRNPLATPFTLGVSAGAAFGAALYMKLGMAFSVLSVQGESISAFLGAILSVLLVYGLTRLRRGFSTAVLLIAGVAVNFFFSSLILFIQYLSDFAGSYRVIRWLMGGFEIVGYRSVFTLLLFLGMGMVVILFLIRELNLLMVGEDIAASRGVEVKWVKLSLFIAASVMIGGVVAVCGPIGFVGMMVPHICRLLIGSDHKYLAPVSILAGGSFLVLCDAFSRLIIAPAEIPVGIITALLGGPFFIWLLIGRSGKRWIFDRQW